MCVAFAVHSHGESVDSFQWKGIDKNLDSGIKSMNNAVLSMKKKFLQVMNFQHMSRMGTFVTNCRLDSLDLVFCKTKQI